MAIFPFGYLPHPHPLTQTWIPFEKEAILDHNRHSSHLIFDTAWPLLIKGILSRDYSTVPIFDRHKGNHLINCAGIFSKGI